MRAFASLLGINIGSLSGILSGKRVLTTKAAERICDRLGLAPEERNQVLHGLKSRSQKSAKIILSGDVPERIEVEEETFRTISDWYHYGIMQLVRTKSYLEGTEHKGAKWIARQLRITELEAKLAIERLIKLDFLVIGKNGRLSRTEKRITTANKNLTSAALKKLQKQIREKAIHSIEHDSIEARSMTSLTMAINPRKIEQAKQLIDEFQEKLSDLLEEGNKEKVYQLEIGLFPIQNMEN